MELPKRSAADAILPSLDALAGASAIERAARPHRLDCVVVATHDRIARSSRHVWRMRNEDAWVTIGPAPIFVFRENRQAFAPNIATYARDRRWVLALAILVRYLHIVGSEEARLTWT
jgi:hypothetical protein